MSILDIQKQMTKNEKVGLIIPKSVKEKLTPKEYDDILEAFIKQEGQVMRSIRHKVAYFSAFHGTHIVFQREILRRIEEKYGVDENLFLFLAIIYLHTNRITGVKKTTLRYRYNKVTGRNTTSVGKYTRQLTDMGYVYVKKIKRTAYCVVTGSGRQLIKSYTRLLNDSVSDFLRENQDVLKLTLSSPNHINKQYLNL
jgi:predicted transcriptional regulator